MPAPSLNFDQKEALRRLRTHGGWFSTYDHHDLISGHTLNSLVKKGIVEKRPRSGCPSITEFSIKTDHL